MNGLKAYKDLKFCPVFNFFESLKEVRYLLILDNYMDLPEVDTTELIEIRNRLSEEYQSHESESQNELLDMYKSNTRMQADYTFVQNALFFMQYKYSGFKADFDGIEKILEAMDYKLNYTNFEELEKEIERLANRSKGITNWITRKNKEIEDYLKAKEKQSEGGGGYLDVVLQIESLANIKIDIYKDNMLKFIHAEKQLRTIIKARENYINKNKKVA